MPVPYVPFIIIYSFYHHIWFSVLSVRIGAEDEEEADSDPEGPKQDVGRHWDESQQSGDGDQRSDHKHLQVRAAVGQVPSEHAAPDADQEDKGGQQPARRRVEVPICRHVLAEQLRCGEVGTGRGRRRGLRDAQLEDEGDQALLGAVVQVSLDAPAGLVGGGDDPGARGAELGVELGVVEGDGELAGDELDSVEPVGGERATSNPSITAAAPRRRIPPATQDTKTDHAERPPKRPRPPRLPPAAHPQPGEGWTSQPKIICPNGPWCLPPGRASPKDATATRFVNSSGLPFGLAPGATGIMLVMSIQAVVFDIGGVLEITPDLGVTGMWESRLDLGPGELNKRMSDVWRGGSIGTISERDVHQAASDILGLDRWQLAEFMADAPRPCMATAGPPWRPGRVADG